MNLQDEIVNHLGREMAQEMDQHIIAGLLIEEGWTEIVVDPWKHSSTSEITQWVTDNIVGIHIKTGNRWVFEIEKDAIIFALRWG
jgi:hypothetical protein